MAVKIESQTFWANKVINHANIAIEKQSRAGTDKMHALLSAAIVCSTFVFLVTMVSTPSPIVSRIDWPSTELVSTFSWCKVEHFSHQTKKTLPNSTMMKTSRSVEVPLYSTCCGPEQPVLLWALFQLQWNLYLTIWLNSSTGATQLEPVEPALLIVLLRS